MKEKSPPNPALSPGREGKQKTAPSRSRLVEEKMVWVARVGRSHSRDRSDHRKMAMYHRVIRICCSSGYGFTGSALPMPPGRADNTDSARCYLAAIDMVEIAYSTNSCDSTSRRGRGKRRLSAQRTLQFNHRVYDSRFCIGTEDCINQYFVMKTYFSTRSRSVGGH